MDDEDDFKSIPAPDDQELRLNHFRKDVFKETEITDSDRFQLICFSRAIIEKYIKKDYISVDIIMNQMFDLLQTLTPIPYIDSLSSNDLIKCCLSYYEEEHSEESAIAAGKLLSLISAQSTKFTLQFKDTNILHILYDKIIERKHELVSIGIEIAKNMLFEDQMINLFDDFYITELCQSFNTEIDDPDESISLIRFFHAFIMKHVDEKNFSKNCELIQHSFVRARQLCGDLCYELILNTFIWLAYYETLDFEFFFSNGFGFIVAGMLETHPNDVIYFYSLIYAKIPESRSSCPIYVEQIFGILFDEDREKSTDYMNLCSVCFFFLSTFLSNDGKISEEQHIQLLTFIIENYENFNNYMKKTSFVLINDLLMTSSLTVLESIDIFKVFDIMNDLVSSDNNEDNIAKGAQTMLFLAKKCDQWKFDLKTPVAQSNYINAIEERFEDFERPEFSAIIDSFTEYFDDPDA